VPNAVVIAATPLPPLLREGERLTVYLIDQGRTRSEHHFFSCLPDFAKVSIENFAKAQW
jgi:hypothetical protein